MKKNEKKIAVVLSGCGYLDGSEITETVSTLIALDKEGVQYTLFAPNMAFPSMDHVTKKTQETRNSLIEAARIARGDINDLVHLKEADFDGLVFPGGFGAAKNLSSWLQMGAKCTLLPQLENNIIAFHAASKPIGAICIAPALVARVLGKHQITVTIGDDAETAAEIQKTGALHEICPVEEYVSDRFNKILSTPAYMYNTTPAKAFSGISKMIRELVEMS